MRIVFSKLKPSKNLATLSLKPSPMISPLISLCIPKPFSKIILIPFLSKSNGAPIKSPKNAKEAILNL